MIHLHALLLREPSLPDRFGWHGLWRQLRRASGNGQVLLGRDLRVTQGMSSPPALVSVRLPPPTAPPYVVDILGSYMLYYSIMCVCTFVDIIQFYILDQAGQVASTGWDGLDQAHSQPSRA